MDANGQQFLPQVALTRAPEGRRKTRRPRETWRRTVERERMAMGCRTWVEAGLSAADRVSWSSKFPALFSIRETVPIMIMLMLLLRV